MNDTKEENMQYIIYREVYEGINLIAGHGRRYDEFIMYGDTIMLPLKKEEKNETEGKLKGKYSSLFIPDADKNEFGQIMYAHNYSDIAKKSIEDLFKAHKNYKNTELLGIHVQPFEQQFYETYERKINQIKQVFSQLFSPAFKENIKTYKLIEKKMLHGWVYYDLKEEVTNGS